MMIYAFLVCFWGLSNGLPPENNNYNLTEINRNSPLFFEKNVA